MLVWFFFFFFLPFSLPPHSTSTKSTAIGYLTARCKPDWGRANQRQRRQTRCLNPQAPGPSSLEGLRLFSSNPFTFLCQLVTLLTRHSIFLERQQLFFFSSFSCTRFRLVLSQRQSWSCSLFVCCVVQPDFSPFWFLICFFCEDYEEAWISWTVTFQSHFEIWSFCDSSWLMSYQVSFETPFSVVPWSTFTSLCLHLNSSPFKFKNF